MLRDRPDPPFGVVPLVTGLLVLHGVGVQRETPGVDGRDEPVVEAGGGHPVQHGLLDLRGFPGQDQLDLVLRHPVDVLCPAGVVPEVLSGEWRDLEERERPVTEYLVVLVVVGDVSLVVVVPAHFQLPVPPGQGGVWIRCGWN